MSDIEGSYDTPPSGDSLPSPPSFADPSIWKVEQFRRRHLLCSRPPYQSGLPISTLHESFAHYLSLISSTSPLPKANNDVRSASFASHKLLDTMGEAFPTKRERSEAFSSGVSPCLNPRFWTSDYSIEGGGLDGVANTWATVDYVYTGPIYPFILREDRNELGDDEGDLYMRIAGDYQHFVAMIREQAESDSRRSKTATMFRDNGVPVFLLCLDGPNLQVSGGFFDGERHFVEPLGPTISMLPDGSGTSRRQDYLTRVLYALRRGARELLNVQSTPPPRTKISPRLPRIYRSCLTLNTNKRHRLHLTDCDYRYSGSERQLRFTATWKKSNSPAFVHATEGPYNISVQRILSSNGYAPRLYATSPPSHFPQPGGTSGEYGAPTAYVMRYLASPRWISFVTFYDTYRWDWWWDFGSDSNKLLPPHHPHRHRRRSPTPPSPAKAAIRKALDRILDFLERQNLVHGRLFPENVMICMDPKDNWRAYPPCVIKRGGFAKLKVLDFTQAGKAGEVFYPYIWNDERPPCPGVLGGPIQIGHDRQMVNSWFDHPDEWI